MTDRTTDRTSGLSLASAAAALAGDGVGPLLSEACRQAGVRLLGHRRRSVHYRDDRSVSHVFEAGIDVDGQRREVLLVAHADRRQLPASAFVLRSGSDEVAVWRFPNDPYLPGLPSAIDQRRVRELLDQLGVGRGQVQLRTRAYRPSRRAVVEVTVAAGEAARRVLYLKVLSGDRAERLAARHRQLAATLPVPGVVGVAARQGILALEALPGRTLRDALSEGEPVPEPDELVAVSRRLMASGLESDRSPRAFADPRRHVARLAELVPELSGTVQRIADAAAAVDGDEVIVHGDLHAGQLLIADGDIVGLLDVDGAGLGLLAHDAGTLVAYLEVLGELRPDRRERIEGYARCVRAAYATEVGPEPLARATAGAWLALATAAYRSQEPDWRRTTVARIDRAAAVLDER